MKEGLPSKLSSPILAGVEDSPESLNARAERILERTDFNTLADLLEEERKNSGITEEINETIRLKYAGRLSKSTGEWLNSKNRISLNTNAIRKEAITAFMEGGTEEFSGIVVSTLVHELVHAASYNEYESHPIRAWLNSLFLGSKGSDRSGYDYEEKIRGIPRGRFTFFNEAVTDSIAEEIYDQYKVRTGDAELKGQKFAQSYVPQRELLKAFLDYTATSTGVTREVVWQGIKQGYFSGLNLDSTELGALYSDLALDSFMRELKTLKKEKLIPGVISNLNLQLDSAHMPEDLVPQVRTAVENLNVSTKAMELA